jgi:hypothetical protein
MFKYFIHIILIFTSLLASIQLVSCSASTGNRYEKPKEKTESKAEEKKDESIIKDKEIEDIKIINEDFNFTPYKSEINITENETVSDQAMNISGLDIWYDYETTDSLNSVESVHEKVSGFRVQVLVTDDFDEANKMRTDIASNTFRKPVYVIFDPPFYKVLVGDFTKVSDANDLSFRLSQIGYTEARVISDTVNVIRQ